MAIDDLLDEHEQSERVRSWLRKNGASILGGVVIAIGAIAGWQWYQKDQGGKLASANVEYPLSAVAALAATADCFGKGFFRLLLPTRAEVFIKNHTARYPCG